MFSYEETINTFHESYTIATTEFLGYIAVLINLAAYYSRTTRGSSRCWSGICTLVD